MTSRTGRTASSPLRLGTLLGGDVPERLATRAADHASNRAILGVLQERCPGERILSEESDGLESAGRGPENGADRLWVVDPLDGTKEFLARNGEFSVMVGLAESGACVLGAVYQPTSDLLHLGVASGGAWA